MKEINDAISLLYGALESDRFFDILPDLIARAVGARSCVIQKTDNTLRPLGMAHAWFTSEMIETYVDEEIFRDDVWANRAAELGIVGSAANIGELMSETQYRNTRFYQDFIHRFGDDTGQCLGAILRRADGGFISLGTHRAFRADAFEEREVRLLNALNPHLLRIVDIHDRISGSAWDLAHMRGIVDRLDRPLLSVSSLGRVIFANAAAESILARNDGLSLMSGRLVALSPSSQRHLGRIINDALMRTGDHGGSLRVERAGAKVPYRLLVSPLEIDQITHAMIVIDDPDSELLGIARQLHDLYGLTRAEAETAIMLGHGHSTEEIAEMRQVSAATVKSLLQRCFRKTETRRATQLGRLVNQLPR